MPHHEKLNYVEYPAKNLAATKAFFQAAFGWSFEDYGPAYTAFAGQGLDGGFFQSDLSARTELGSALLVFYSDELEATWPRSWARVVASSSRSSRFRVAADSISPSPAATSLPSGGHRMHDRRTGSVP
jgi:catechol 2,3-dioxygenase-like lactoylglutathione lyase family enzyme